MNTPLKETLHTYPDMKIFKSNDDVQYQLSFFFVDMVKKIIRQINFHIILNCSYILEKVILLWAEFLPSPFIRDGLNEN